MICRRLINGLSHADVLHLGKALYDDLNVFDPSRKDYEQRGHVVAHEKLFCRWRSSNLILSLNIEPGVLDCLYYYKPKFHLIYNKFSFLNTLK